MFFLAFLRPFLIALLHASHKCIKIICIPLQNVAAQITFHITILLVLHERILILYISRLHSPSTSEMQFIHW